MFFISSNYCCVSQAWNETACEFVCVLRKSVEYDKKYLCFNVVQWHINATTIDKSVDLFHWEKWSVNILLIEVSTSFRTVAKRVIYVQYFCIEWRLNEMYENQAVVIHDEYISFGNEKTFIDGLLICFGWRWQNFEVVEVSAEPNYAMPLFLISIFVLTFARPLTFHLSFMSKMEFPTPKFLRYVVVYLYVDTPSVTHARVSEHLGISPSTEKSSSSPINYSVFTHL